MVQEVEGPCNSRPLAIDPWPSPYLFTAHFNSFYLFTCIVHEYIVPNDVQITSLFSTTGPVSETTKKALAAPI